MQSTVKYFMLNYVSTLTGRKPELIALQITECADVQCNTSDTEFCYARSVVACSVKHEIYISSLRVFLACTF